MYNIPMHISTSTQSDRKVLVALFVDVISWSDKALEIIERTAKVFRAFEPPLNPGMVRGRDGEAELFHVCMLLEISQ